MRPGGARTGIGLGMPGIGAPASRAGNRPDAPGDACERATTGFDAFRGDIEAAERRVAREIDPGARALVVAILVFVLLVSFVLPHTGGARGLDVLVGNDAAIDVGIVAAVAGVHLAGAGVQRRLLDAGPADPAVGVGLDGAGRVHRGVLRRDCWRCGRARPRPHRIPDPASAWSSRGSP